MTSLEAVEVGRAKLYSVKCTECKVNLMVGPTEKVCPVVEVSYQPERSSMTEANSEQQKFQFFYQRLVGDIENTKRRQWLVPYYILLLFAAIIGFVTLGKLPKEAICLMKVPLSVLALIIAIVGIWHIIDTHLTQVKYRRQIYKLENSNLPNALFVREILPKV